MRVLEAIEGLGIESVRAVEAERKAAEEEVGQTQFLEMLVAQLENQDPLNPQDSADFAAQLAQFSQVEQLIAMRAGIDTLVSQAETSDEETASANGLDPAALVGRDVTVIGSQIEVDAARSLVRMPLRTIETATEARVEIYDADGNRVHAESILPRDANGEIALRPGDHEYVFDPAAHNLPSGVYRIEFSGRGAADEEITILPMVQGRVTGAILAGEPRVRIGDRIFPVADVLEVRLADDASATRPRDDVGGGQTVFAPQAQRRPELVAGP